MKRFTLFLALCLTMIGTAMAQTVTDLANLSNYKAYTLRTSRSDLVAKSDGSRIASTNDINGTFDETNTQYQFALLKNTSGSYFLYSISANKFVNKTGNLVNYAEPILFKNGNATGTFVLYFDASHYINIGGSNQLSIDGWSTVDAGNSFTINSVADFSPSTELLNSIEPKVVTVNYKVGENTYSTVTKNLYLNSPVNAEKFAADLNGTYLTFASTDVETVTAETTTINVTCTVETLPFDISESYDNAKWYMVNMHSNEYNYMWTATTTDGTNPTLTVVNKGSVYKETTAPDDTRLWCFVGDIFGFKIYNKAVGSAYTMNKTSDGDNAISWGEAESGTLYHLHKTATSISNGFCFLPTGHSNYLNHRGATIQGWTSRDGGSTCRAFTPDAFLLNYAADIPAGPANSLGTAQYFNTEDKFESFNNAIAAATADHFSATATTNLATILTDYASDDANATPNNATITSGSYYRLMNYHYRNYMTSGLEGTTNTLWGGLSATKAPSAAGTIVKITADGDNYKMSAQGLEFGQITDRSARLHLTGGGLFTINNTGNKFTFMDVSTCDPVPTYASYRAIHQASDNRIVGWEAGADATKWYIIPATDIKVALNTVGDASYATAYLPFAVEGDGVTKLYKGSIGKNVLNEDVLKMNEVSGVIPAKTALVLKGAAGAAYTTLTISNEEGSEVGENALQGTISDIELDANNRSSYLVLGLGNTSKKIGFYTPSESLTAIDKNKAYLNASSVGTVANAIALNFEDVTTGISFTEINGENAPVYDLSGRRVLRTVKGGLYIQNGKKYIVK